MLISSCVRLVGVIRSLSGEGTRLHLGKLVLAKVTARHLDGNLGYLTFLLCFGLVLIIGLHAFNCHLVDKLTRRDHSRIWTVHVAAGRHERAELMRIVGSFHLRVYSQLSTRENLAGHAYSCLMVFTGILGNIESRNARKFIDVGRISRKTIGDLSLMR